MMFLGLPDDIHEEKPSFLQSKTKSEKNNGPRRNDEGQGLNDEGQGLYVPFIHILS